MSIVVVGHKAETFLNGQPMISMQYEKIGKATGQIALRIHSGGGIKVMWRNLRIKELK